jgi:phosphoserine phosphatase
MRISFDLDGTLISENIEWKIEPDLRGFRGEKERLRKGTVDLFIWIREQNHEIWIFTIYRFGPTESNSLWIRSAK